MNELKDYPFWRHVRTKPLKVVQMCPFGMLMYKQKADVAWPVGGLRSIQHGSVAMDPVTMVSQGLPISAATLKDEMSDKGSFMRLNPAFFLGSWFAAGCRLYLLLGAILSSVPSSPIFMPPKEFPTMPPNPPSTAFPMRPSKTACTSQCMLCCIASLTPATASFLGC